MIYRRVFIVFLCIFICATVQAEGDFKTRTNLIFTNVASNFSLPGSVSLDYKSVVDGSAEARYFPFKGYYIRLDVAELENATNYELEGMFAHELAHLEKYNTMNKISLIFYGFHYQFSADFKRKVERETDLTAIQKGFGAQLAAFRTYRLETGSESDVLILEKYYISPEEINNSLYLLSK